MKKPLVDVIFASERRKNTLLLLRDGPQEMRVLLESMQTTRQALLPQLKILEENHLITHYDDMYELTPISKLIVDEMAPLVDTLKVLDLNVDFWGERDLEFIPPELLERIRELYPYTINESSLHDLYELNKDFVATTARSKKMCAVTNLFHPSFIDLFAQWTQSNVMMPMFISPELLDKLKTQYRNYFQEMLNNNNIRFYLCQESFNFAYFALNDYCILMAMIRKDGWFDNKDLISFSSSALKWGRDLVEHYKKNSVLISSIE